MVKLWKTWWVRGIGAAVLGWTTVFHPIAVITCFVIAIVTLVFFLFGVAIGPDDENP